MNKEGPPALITQFHHKLTKVKQILHSHFHILQSETDTRSVFPTKPKFVFQHPPNLRNILVRTNPSSKPPQTGAHTCKRPRCRTCFILITSSTVTINTANGRYTPNPKGTFHISNVIYILTCKFCDVFYVGQTDWALNFRINNHRHFRSIKKPNASFSLHTESHNTNFDIFFLVVIIHILPRTTSTSTRPLWEGAFIHGLSAKIYLFFYIFNTFPFTIPPCAYMLYSCKMFQAPEIYALQQSVVLQAWRIVRYVSPLSLQACALWIRALRSLPTHD